MANLLAAAEAIKREAKRCEQLVEAAAYLETIGSLEQAEAEARRRMDEANTAANLAQQNLDALSIRVRDSESRAKAIVQDAKDQAKTIASEASTAKELIVQNAQAEAIAIIEMARTSAVEIVAAANAHKTEVETHVAELARDRIALAQTVADAQAELTELTEKIDKAQAEVRRLLGA